MRTRTFRITTLVLVLAALAGVIVPALVGDDGPSRSTVTVAGGPASLPEALRRRGRPRTARWTSGDWARPRQSGRRRRATWTRR